MSAIPIVLAEDEPHLRRLYADYLCAHDYHVMVAGDGLEALSLLHRVQPRILLLDIIMPGMNGIETCRRARQVVEYSTPIVFITSLDYADHVKEGLEAGGDDYILKTSPLEVILDRVRHWTDRTARSKNERRRSRALSEIRALVEEHALGKGESSVEWRPDPRATALNDFLARALAAAGPGFGSTREQRVYFLGYVAGVVDYEMSQAGLLRPQFVKYIRSALRSSGIVDTAQIEEMVAAIDTISADDLAKTGWRNGRRDKGAAATGGEGFVPSGLAEFKAVA
jgi:DNA-binding response OmpR family regulator